MPHKKVASYSPPVLLVVDLCVPVLSLTWCLALLLGKYKLAKASNIQSWLYCSTGSARLQHARVMSHVYLHGVKVPKEDINLNKSNYKCLRKTWCRLCLSYDKLGVYLSLLANVWGFLQFAITSMWCNPYLLTLFLSPFLHTRKHTHTLSLTNTHANPPLLPAFPPSFLAYQWMSRIGGNPRWVLGWDAAPLITSWPWLQPSPQGSCCVTHSSRHVTFLLTHAQASVPDTLLKKNPHYYCCYADITVTLSMEMAAHS